MTRIVKPPVLYVAVLGAAAVGLITITVQARAGSLDGGMSRPPVPLTFNKDIAPIIFKNCAGCHHPGGAAPFSLLSYQDTRKHAKQIAVVTESRYMPPWLPEPGYGDFSGERRLSDDEIGIIKRWVEQGAAEGAVSDLMPAPKFNDAWQLGQPDLVIKLPAPYTLQASGSDVFRNFVIPVPVTRTRYVKAVEILPGNNKIVHHANILIDRTHSFRRIDQQDHEIGFEGMDLRVESEIFDPDSHFLFWKPGTPPFTEPTDMAWLLNKGTDLILNMHLRPSGKPEVIQPVIGIYFTDNPPSRFPMLLQLEHDGAIDIPPGMKDFIVTDDFELPVDVDALGVYPHAHYLGKDIQGFATLPDGTRKWLIRIKDWDINRQAVYRYVKPIFLPQGTIISMRYSYDNSAANVRNPNHPPQRVVAGNKSSDEMGHLWIQVLPRARDDVRIVLQESLMRQRIKKYPDDFTAHFNLGAVLQSMGKLEEGINQYKLALRTRPNDVTALNSLGSAFQSMGKIEEAISQFRLALRIKPDYGDAHYNLGNALLGQDKPDEAISHFREVLRLQPDDAPAHNDLGSALAIQGNMVEAASHFEQALRINPQYADAHYNLGLVFEIQAKLAEAINHFEHALRIDPQHAGALESLNRARAKIKARN